METLQTFLTQYSGFEAYIIFFLLIAASSIGLFNSDIVFITSGALSGMGVFDYRILMIVGLCALMTGDSIAFFSARKWGRSLIRRRPFSFVLNDEKMDAAEAFFKKKGIIMLFLVRFTPMMRTPIFLVSGSLKADPKKFYLLNGLASAIYLPLVIIGSNRAGANAEEIIATLKKFQFIPVLLLVTVILFFVIKKNRNKKAGVA
jgi:membrane-associated protein